MSDYPKENKCQYYFEISTCLRVDMIPNVSKNP